MKIKSMQVFNFYLFTKPGPNIILLIFGLIFSQNSYTAPYCDVENGCGSGGSSSSQKSSSSNSSSPSRTERTQQAIGALQSAIGVWADNAEQKEEAERERRAAKQAEQDAESRAIDAKYEQFRTNFSKNVAQFENDKSLNPWGNTSGEKKEKEKLNSDGCIQQQFPTSSKEKYSLKNTCDYPVNIKYIFSSSKPFSGTYTTLRPNQETVETARKDETFRYFVCTAPEVPQSLDGGCI